MTFFVLLCRIVLMVVFLVSGMSKIVDRKGFRNALFDFGVPSRFSGILNVIIPLVEICIAVALIFQQTNFIGGIGALGLLSIFSIAISYNLARGRTPNCHCFGQLYSKPIGKETLVRNGILALVAVFIIWHGRENLGPGLFDWVGNLRGAEIIILAIALIALSLAAGEGWFLLHILQQQGRFLLRIESLEKAIATGNPIDILEVNEPKVGLALASKAPIFQITDLYKRQVGLNDLRVGGKPLMLVFSDPSCNPCNALMPDVAKWQKIYASALNIAIISRGSIEDNIAKQKELNLRNVLLQNDREVAEMYQCGGTPGAVLVQPDGTIGSYLAMGSDAIERLAQRTVSPAPTNSRPHNDDCNCRNGQNGNSESHSETSMIGQPVPKFELPNLNGETISFDKYFGHEMVIIFWNPGCGFCNRMLNDLKAWENQRPATAPKLLLISTGDVVENRALGIQSTVVLDQGFSVGNKLGASGTPSAVFVDAEGKIASEIVAGAQAVLELARVGTGNLE